MKRKRFLIALSTLIAVSALTACGTSTAPIENTQPAQTAAVETSESDSSLHIAKQGMFSSGGTVTEPVAGDYDSSKSWLDDTRAGTTAHVDHANELYQIPETITAIPLFIFTATDSQEWAG